MDLMKIFTNEVHAKICEAVSEINGAMKAKGYNEGKITSEIYGEEDMIAMYFTEKGYVEDQPNQDILWSCPAVILYCGRDHLLEGKWFDVHDDLVGVFFGGLNIERLFDAFDDYRKYWDAKKEKAKKKASHELMHEIKRAYFDYLGAINEACVDEHPGYAEMIKGVADKLKEDSEGYDSDED